MNLGGAYPLALINLVLGEVTCSGKLSLLLDYADGTIDTGTAERIRDQAFDYLLE
jgi:hypothetical protein